MQNKTIELKEEILNKIRAKEFIHIRNLTEDYPIADIAELISDFSLQDKILSLRILRKDDAADLFAYFDIETQIEIAKSFSEDWAMKILQELQTNELANILEELPTNIASSILKLTPPEKRADINLILSFEDEQIGSIMQVDFLTLQPQWTVKKSISIIRKKYKINPDISSDIYITDGQGKLLGCTTISDVFLNNDSVLIENIYDPVKSVFASDNKEDAAAIFTDQDRNTLPVIFQDERIVGIISSDDVIDVIQDEATEDMYKLAGISAASAEDSYIKNSIFKVVKSRIFWLIILMISSTISQFIIQKFTDISSNVVANLHLSISTGLIVGLIPIISGSAGNAGSQSSTTITRSAAIGEISSKSLFKVLKKEFLVGLVIGAIMFFANVIRLIFYFLIFNEGSQVWTIALIIFASSLSLLIVILIAKIMGTIIPLLAIRWKRDPAVMSAPILATSTDAISTLIFFGLNIGVLYLGSALNVFA
ncbi:magnesium transporter [Mycoplasmopsis synoviae]|uniref:magnesium transporter n=1 Tax=Mycoplasmopsis synoviae TaxID=2109 RepID=UPI000CA2B885|nr:magnesium transporter [Mycoplasmopsis synoviae]AKJ20718.1 Mg/Co/Ni transporter MgtE / CBS domain [Mycoplasmopsis synoviae]AQU48041.1 Mg/Co/Ni transporter MgtE / CBS domain [Mycoplasmopsis synoviae]AWL84277.1 magnesium transporter [Mycoplasmopsis synoviae]QLE13994.1 magnesium transporter [Mycoplasmopsis synoviae]UBX97453.1 magnesium transporter [Mycoplasmopsis synoviae]